MSQMILRKRKGNELFNDSSGQKKLNSSTDTKMPRRSSRIKKNTVCCKNCSESQNDSVKEKKMKNISANAKMPLRSLRKNGKDNDDSSKGKNICKSTNAKMSQMILKTEKSDKLCNDLSEKEKNDKSTETEGEILANSTVQCGHSRLSESDLSEIRRHRILLQTAMDGNLEMMVNLLNSGASVEAECCRLLFRPSNVHTAPRKFTVGYGRRLYFQNIETLFNSLKNYVTPLRVAAASGHVKCVQLLIERGANVNAKDRFGATALHMAAENGHYQCLKALLEANADCCVPINYDSDRVYSSREYVGGTTPLHLAAENNHVGCVIELIQYGADCSAIDHFDRTSLYLAAEAGHGECVLAHLRNTTKPYDMSPNPMTPDTPLHFAVSRLLTDCVKELLRLGSDVNYLNSQGHSPLHCVFLYTGSPTKKLEILKLLVLEGFNTDVNCTCGRGFAALHYVNFVESHIIELRKAKIEYAKFLIAYGADVNINIQGITLLELELKSSVKNFDVLKYLVKSMLHLPHLEDLRVCRFIYDLTSADPLIEIEHENDYVENTISLNKSIPCELLEIELIQGETSLFFEMNEYALEFMQLIPHRPKQPLPRPIRYEATQTLIRHVYTVLDCFINKQNDTGIERETTAFASLCTLKKQLWYEQMASNPRTLQHCCRYSIRSYMGSTRLKFVGKLPIPTVLQKYLLLE